MATTRNYSTISRFAICLLTVRPTERFYAFCKKLANYEYDVYICIDDNQYEIPNYDYEIPLLKFDNETIERIGFKSSVLYFRGKACSRDKALYFFCKIKKTYKHVWFIEEDVFIPSVDTIRDIDQKYGNADLLCKSRHSKQNTGQWPHWGLVVSQTNKQRLQYERSMVCAIRVSYKMLLAVETYVKEHRSLFMDEALFNTLANDNQLSVLAIPELSTIDYRHEWKLEDINLYNLYHPIKDTDKHDEFRKRLQTR